MLWTWEMIRDEWLAGSRVATPPGEVVAAFELSEQLLGREWVDSQREHGGGRTRPLAPPTPGGTREGGA